MLFSDYLKWMVDVIIWEGEEEEEEVVYLLSRPTSSF